MFGELSDAGPVGALTAGLERQQRQIVGEALQDCMGRGLFLCMGTVVEVAQTSRGGPPREPRHGRPSGAR